jgi:hypothetical protein
VSQRKKSKNEDEDHSSAVTVSKGYGGKAKAGVVKAGKGGKNSDSNHHLELPPSGQKKSNANDDEDSWLETGKGAKGVKGKPGRKPSQHKETATGGRNFDKSPPELDSYQSQHSPPEEDKRMTMHTYKPNIGKGNNSNSSSSAVNTNAYTSASSVYGSNGTFNNGSSNDGKNVPPQKQRKLPLNVSNNSTLSTRPAARTTGENTENRKRPSTGNQSASVWGDDSGADEDDGEEVEDYTTQQVYIYVCMYK